MSSVLLSELRNQSEKLPEHIGFILDGNRRWAKANGQTLIGGYQRGAQKAEDILRWTLESGVKILSIWVWSTENFRRAKSQVSFMMRLLKDRIKGAMNEKALKENDVQVKFLGDLETMPLAIQELARELERDTANAQALQLNICMGYGGRQEIVKACQQLANEVQNGELPLSDITEERLQRAMYYDGVPPDLIIRTGGEQRTSGFLMWHAAYSEYFFSEKFLPDFEKEDFYQAIVSFQERQRRFGK